MKLGSCKLIEEIMIGEDKVWTLTSQRSGYESLPEVYTSTYHVMTIQPTPWETSLLAKGTLPVKN